MGKTEKNPNFARIVFQSVARIMITTSLNSCEMVTFDKEPGSKSGLIDIL